jgi:phage terminase large subunit
MPAATSVETYQPSDVQNQFHGDGSKFRLLLGAWRAGKSVAMIWECILLGLEHPGARFVIFRKTYPALRDTTWRDFLLECPPQLIDGEPRRTEGREEVTLQGGTLVMARCLDDWRKLGSSSFDGVFGDEAYEFTTEDHTMLSKGRLSGKVGPRRLVYATNPPNRDHWLYKTFVLEKQPNMSVHHFATLDNWCRCYKRHPGVVEEDTDDETEDVPVCSRHADKILHDGSVGHYNISDDYIAELQKMPENRRRRFLDGQWGFTATGTPVFPEFSETRHVTVLQPERGVTLIRGWDFGYRHPACVFVQVLPTGHVHVLDELLGTNEDIEMFARRVKQRTMERFGDLAVQDYCDAAGVQKNDMGFSCVQILRRGGILPRFRKLKIWPTVEALRDLIARTYLGVPLLRVHAECTWVREALTGGYRLHVGVDGVETPKKDGLYDHAVDALRYALADILHPVASAVEKDRALSRPIEGQRVDV